MLQKCRLDEYALESTVARLSRQWSTVKQQAARGEILRSSKRNGKR